MKSSILNLLALSLIISFTASCGKKESGGGSSASPYSNGIYNPTGTATGDVAYNSLAAWQVGAVEASIVGTHLYYSKRAVSNFPKAMCQKNTVVVDCENPNGCFKHTNNGIFKGSVVMNNSTFLGLTVKKYGDCDINSSFILYTKAGNLELKDAVLGTGKFLIKALTQQTGAIYTVFYGAFDGSNTPTSYAVINTSLPTILNPTEVGSISNGYINPTTKLYDFASGL